MPISGDPNGLIFSIEQAGGDLLPIVVAVLICAILFDLAAFWVQHRSPAQVQIARTTDTADLTIDPDGSVEMFHQIIVPSGGENAAVIDATLAIFSLFTIEIDCFLHSQWETHPGLNRPVDHQNPLKIAANSTCVIHVGAKIAKGPLARWLKVATGPALGWLRLPRGEIRLRAEPQAVRVPFPLRFRRRC